VKPFCITVTVAAALLCATATATAGATAGSHKCARFIVGRANSTAYPHMQLPARGTASGASCATLRRIARGLNNGAYRVPSHAGAQAPAYGRPFKITDRGRQWRCRVQDIGLSGPTYAVKCTSASAALRWQVG